MPRLIIKRQAEFELNKAVIWYEGQCAGLGVELLAEFRATIQLIRERPTSFPVDYRYARRARMNRFPYAIHFVPTESLVSVIAVLHTSQDKRRQLRGRL